MNKIAFVSGASRGIGKAIAHTLALEGYDLYLTCQNSVELLENLKRELESKYEISCKIFVGDMGDYEFVSSIFKSIPHIDVLVNNAGISFIGLLSEMSVTEWHSVLSTNLDSCFYTCKCAIPLMLQKKQGNIINISSVWGNVGASMEVAYSTSKGGMNSFTKALAKELAPSNIQVNAVACGMIDTDMNKEFSKEELYSIMNEIPADRMGTAIEVANLVLHIIQSPSYLTGQVVNLDGGWI